MMLPYRPTLPLTTASNAVCIVWYRNLSIHTNGPCRRRPRGNTYK